MQSSLTPDQGRFLLTAARETIREKLGLIPAGRSSGADGEDERDAVFKEKRGTFVTLHLDGRLRGCIGSLEADRPLLQSVRDNAGNAAFNDSRFSPLTADEVDHVHLEVSILTEPETLEHGDSQDLCRKLRPGIDGVIIEKGWAKATFLPQVWDQLPETEQFLSHLCRKAGLAPDEWKKGTLGVKTYQVQYFEE